MIPVQRSRRGSSAVWAVAVFVLGLAACGEQTVDHTTTALTGARPESYRAGESESAVPTVIDARSRTPSSVNIQEKPSGTTQSALSHTGAVFGDSESQSCVEGYSPMAVAGRSFAFDGTVIAIGAPVSNSNGPGRDPLEVVGVTFRVNEWFRGHSGEVAVVDLYPPNSTIGAIELPAPAYEIGSRLLVSGEPRWGGAPLDSAIAWPCGFTRYFDPRTAAEWAAATR